MYKIKGRRHIKFGSSIFPGRRESPGTVLCFISPSPGAIIEAGNRGEGLYFSPIVGENRVIQIYDLQEYFIRILRDVQQERNRDGRGPGKMGPPPPPRRF